MTEAGLVAVRKIRPSDHIFFSFPFLYIFFFCVLPEKHAFIALFRHTNTKDIPYFLASNHFPFGSRCFEFLNPFIFLSIFCSFSSSAGAHSLTHSPSRPGILDRVSFAADVFMWCCHNCFFFFCCSRIASDGDIHWRRYIWSVQRRRRTLPAACCRSLFGRCAIFCLCRLITTLHAPLPALCLALYFITCPAIFLTAFVVCYCCSSRKTFYCLNI